MNWRDYDGLESSISRVAVEVSDVLERVKALAPDHYDTIMTAAQVLTDAMRQARKDAQERVVAERGWRS